MIKRDAHWRKMERAREKTGNLPKTAFDFISVHKNDRTGTYSLISPMIIVERNPEMRRPLFELDEYVTYRQAARAAEINAAFETVETGIGIYCVDCTDNNSGSYAL